MYAAFKHIKLIVSQDLRLYFSPLSGAFKAVKIELARPKNSGIKNIAMDDVRLFFAPLIGAVDGVRKELGGNNLESDMAQNTPNNAPSKTGNPSGGGRGNNPPAKGK